MWPYTASSLLWCNGSLPPELVLIGGSGGRDVAENRPVGQTSIEGRSELLPAGGGELIWIKVVPPDLCVIANESGGAKIRVVESLGKIGSIEAVLIAVDPGARRLRAGKMSLRKVASLGDCSWFVCPHSLNIIPETQLEDRIGVPAVVFQEPQTVMPLIWPGMRQRKSSPSCSCLLPARHSVGRGIRWLHPFTVHIRLAIGVVWTTVHNKCHLQADLRGGLDWVEQFLPGYVPSGIRHAKHGVIMVVVR